MLWPFRADRDLGLVRHLSPIMTAMRVLVNRSLELHLNGKIDVVTASKAKLLFTDLQCRVVD